LSRLDDATSTTSLPSAGAQGGRCRGQRRAPWDSHEEDELNAKEVELLGFARCFWCSNYSFTYAALRKRMRSRKTLVEIRCMSGRLEEDEDATEKLDLAHLVSPSQS
jgi:hypothetical protein